MLSRLVRRVLRPYQQAAAADLTTQLNPLRGEIARIRQQLRYLAIASLRAQHGEVTDLTSFELSIFSQNGEDGALLEILRRIGDGGRFFVEIGANSNEANCLLLADAFGWRGLFVDADEGEFATLQRKYSAGGRVRVAQAFVTRENVVSVLRAADVPKDIDVLSIDIDGNDYWVWQALTGYTPRVVIIEYNSGLSPERLLVQPYEPTRTWNRTDFFGASLGALRRLAQSKGYRLVYADLTGTNAFFVRDDLAGSHFPSEAEIPTRPPNPFLAAMLHPARGSEDRFLDLNSPPGAQEPRSS